jgi:hypothetical protein
MDSGMEKVIRKISTDDIPDDALFWKSKTPLERLSALEFLRRQMYDNTGGIQRVLKIVEIERR